MCFSTENLGKYLSDSRSNFIYASHFPIPFHCGHNFVQTIFETHFSEKSKHTFPLEKEKKNREFSTYLHNTNLLVWHTLFEMRIEIVFFLFFLFHSILLEFSISIWMSLLFATNLPIIYSYYLLMLVFFHPSFSLQLHIFTWYINTFFIAFICFRLFGWASEKMEKTKKKVRKTKESRNGYRESDEHRSGAKKCGKIQVSNSMIQYWISAEKHSDATSCLITIQKYQNV